MFDSLFVLNILIIMLLFLILATVVKMFEALIGIHFSASHVPFFMWMTLLVVEMVVAYCLQEGTYSYLENKVEAGYSVYVDGQEADAENIEFSQYRYFVDDEKKKICLR